MKLRDQSRSDQTRYRNIKGVMVVGGYHYGCKERRNQGYTNHRHGQIIRVPYINTKKEYSFKITKKTHNLRYCKVGHTALVITKFGKRNLVISKVLNVIGSKAVGRAMNLRPVVNFRSNGLTKGRWGYLYQTFVIGGAKPVKKLSKKNTAKKFKIYYCKPEQSFTKRIAMDGYDKVLGGLKGLKNHYNDKRHLKLNGERVWRVFKGTNLLKRVDNVKVLHANTGTHGDYNSTSSQLGKMKTAREWLGFLRIYLGQLGVNISTIQDKRSRIKHESDVENLRTEYHFNAMNKQSMHQAKLDTNKYPHLKEQAMSFLKGIVKGGKRFNAKYHHRYLCHQILKTDPIALLTGFLKVFVTMHRPYDIHYTLSDEGTREYVAIYKLNTHELIFSDNLMMVIVADYECEYHHYPDREYQRILDYIYTHSNINMYNGYDIGISYYAYDLQDIASDFYNFLETCRKGYRIIGIKD